MGFDRLIDFRQRVARRVTRPGKLGLGVKNGDVSLGRASSLDDLGEARARLPLMAHEEGGELGGSHHRRRQANQGELRRHVAQACKVERQEVAALASSKRVQLIDDDHAERPEQSASVGVGQHQRDLFRRGRRMSGGATRWRWRREGGVSPVRVSRPMGSPISAIGAARLRPISTAAFSGET